MTSSKQFNSSDDFRRALDTIVRYKDEWLFARGAEKAYHMNLYALPDTRVLKHSSVHVDDEALSLGAATLSLFNHNGRAILPMRDTQRRYRYGTPPEVLRFYYAATLEQFRGDNLAFSQGFIDMLGGVYPSVKDAANTVMKGGSTTEVVISRFFWLKKNNLGLLTLNFRDLGPILWIAPSGDVHMVEKTTTSKYLTQCSRMLSRILHELQDMR